MIRDGLYDLDPYCRKVSMAVLKSNLKTLASDGKVYQGVQTKAEFELMWTTFFDLYDTLESFGSHLTKVSINSIPNEICRLFGKGPSSSMAISANITIRADCTRWLTSVNGLWSFINVYRTI